MAHPYRSAGRAGAKLKFKNMLGSDKGAKHVNDDSVASPNAKVTNGVDDVKIMGKTPPKRLDRARGGKVGKTTVNVIVPPAQPGPAMPPPPLPMPPPMAGPPPGGPGGPPGMPPKGPTMPQPGAGFPLPKASGGGVGGTPLTGGKKGAMQRKINALDPLKGIMPKEGIGKDYVPGLPAGFELNKKSGGYISGNSLKRWASYARQNSYHKKSGGGITKAKLTGGADSGKGRLEHSKAQHKDMKDE